MSGERPIWVFAGPSLPSAARPAANSVVWRAPAMAGDGLEALEAAPRTVVLIDGFFNCYPAIRHKELLALVARGVRVIGGASMGALRAAELQAHGMEGVGAIFRAYARGQLTRDDEVAVLHGPQAMDWAPLTLPLVNVRATLAASLRQGVLTPEAARRLRVVAAGIFFQDRTWATLAEAAAGRVPADALAAFTRWAPRGYVDLKRRDALACLAAALTPADAGPVRAHDRQSTFTAALATQVTAGLRPRPASGARRS